MSARPRRNWIVFLITVVLLLALPISISAQLEPSSWTEWIEFGSGDFNASISGERPHYPDPLSERFYDPHYLCDASVSFPLTGPPSGTIRGELTIDTPEAAPFLVVRFDFESFFRVQQLGTPPVAVNFVPVTIQRAGHAEIPVGYPPAPVPMTVSVHTEFHVSSDLGTIEIADEIAANNFGGAQQSSFAETHQFWLPLQETASVYAFTVLDIGGATSAGSVEATGWIDPVIEVADAIIAGTSNSYREFFKVETSPGFWALPTETKSWGAIKRMFAD